MKKRKRQSQPVSVKKRQKKGSKPSKTEESPSESESSASTDYSSTKYHFPGQSEEEEDEEEQDEDGDQESEESEAIEIDESESDASVAKIAKTVKTKRNVKNQAPQENGDIKGSVTPIPNQFFRSWEDLISYLEKFMAETKTKIVISNTDNVQIRNKKLKNGAAFQKHGVQPDYVPDVFRAWRRLYICTHGWPEKTRGQGKRPRRTLRTTNCPFRFTAEVVRSSEGGDWVIVVKNGVFQHNHEVNEVTALQYPMNRRIPEWEPVLDDLRLMLRMGGKTVRMYEYIRDSTQYKVRMSDVHNLVARLRSEVRGGDDDVAVADFLMKFQLEHDGNCAAVNETSTGESGVISWTTNHQRVLFDRFPELLLLDCTHKTNK